MTAQAFGDTGSAPGLQLVCLPHAGGSAALYRDWQRRMPQTVRILALELPGHGAQRAMPAPRTWPEAVAAIDAICAARVDPQLPFALFGHSMGALLGLELLHARRARGAAEALWFGASAAAAPSLRRLEPEWLHCTREAMQRRLRELGGTPQALLDDADFIELVMPVLRADFHLCGIYPSHYASQRRLPLSCPIDVFFGREDTATALGQVRREWCRETRAACDEYGFAGGHFYLDEAPDALIETVVARLQAMQAAVPPAPRPGCDARSPGIAWGTP